MSLAAIKRRLTVGTAVHIENHRNPGMSHDATVVTVQTNAIALSVPPGGKHTRSWFRWPKAAEIRVNPDGGFTRLDPNTGEPRLTVTFLQWSES
jgi:hypothetical protein